MAPTEHQQTDEAPTGVAPPGDPPAPSPSWLERVNWAQILTNYATLLVLLVLIVVFSIFEPDTFPKTSNIQTMISTQSVLGLLALGTVAPLIVGEFDLSVASNLSFSAIVAALMISHGHGVVLALLAVLGVGIVIGLINAVLLLRLQINSFIATLGTGIILAGLGLWASNGDTVYKNVGGEILSLGQTIIFGFLPLAGVYVLVAAVGLWYLFERTPLGREMYITGYGREAARLAGIPIQRRIMFGFVLSGVFAALAGFLNTANLGSASPSVGDAFLLPAFAAAFLGSTTIRTGRFNIPGTIVGIAFLAVGTTGLQLAGAQYYIQDFFNGLALLVAVAASQVGVRRLKNRSARAGA